MLGVMSWSKINGHLISATAVSWQSQLQIRSGDAAMKG